MNGRARARRRGRRIAVSAALLVLAAAVLAALPGAEGHHAGRVQFLP